ncbi:MAG: zinc ribbon domain-containing protein [Clostridiaceae bacterium]|nr:zinc ribbon domain-containing protein [Clostridiaceae bacterium]
MYCPKCGAPLEDHTKICMNCGASARYPSVAPVSPGLRIGTPESPPDQPVEPALPSDFPPPLFGLFGQRKKHRKHGKEK